MHELLSPRQLEVARLVSEGLSNKGIARRLRIAEGTIKIHLHQIYERLGIANRVQLAMLVIDRKEAA